MKKAKRLISLITSAACAAGTLLGGITVNAETSYISVGLALNSDKTTFTLEEVQSGTASTTVYVDSTGYFTADQNITSVEFKLNPTVWGVVDPINLKISDSNAFSTDKGNVVSKGAFNSTLTATGSIWNTIIPSKLGYSTYNYLDTESDFVYSDGYEPRATIMTDSQHGKLRTEEANDDCHVAEFEVVIPTDAEPGEYTINFLQSQYSTGIITDEVDTIAMYPISNLEPITFTIADNETDINVEHYIKYGYNGNTYQIVNEAISWTDAKERCELMGGHLVTIADEGEQLFVESIIQEYQDVDNFWTGGYLDKYSEEWVWIDGTPFEYTNWDDGQPDFHQNEEFYIRLTNKDIYYDTWIANMGKWNDCANEASGDDNTGDAVGIQTLAFVCEWDNTSLQFEKTDEDNDLIYDSNMISNCGEDAISVNIPSEFGDLPVTSIGENAFSSCSALENVRIPESVTAIEDYAFFGCNSLLHIAIPASVETIGVGALGYSSDGSKISGFTISGTPGSAAESYAFSNGFTFTATNADTGDSPVLSKTILSLNAGDSHVLQVKNYDGEITWVSNDNSVATVNKGFVSAVAEGETVIYAILTDAVLRCNITVSPKVIVTTPAVTTTDITTTTTVTTTAKIDYLEVKENNGTIVIIDCNELIINVVIPEKIDSTEVSKVNDYALSSEDIETVTFENPNVEITDSATTINEDAVIYGYWDSTAHDYAIKYDREFVSLDEPQDDNNEEQDNTNDDNNDNQSVPSITGDANNDGNVNVRDCAFIAQALAKGTTNNLPASADYNGDNKINVRDAAAIASDLAKPWKTTYRTQIIDHFLSEVNYSFKKEELKYALMYIDNDEIPEVLVYHIGSGVNALYSYYNNQAYIVAWSESARNNAFVGYMEKKGLYKTHLSAGAFSGGTNIYKLQNANASLYESIYFDVDMTTNEATYTFNGKAIDKNLFDQKTQQYENDFKSATSISYNEFIKRLS